MSLLAMIPDAVQDAMNTSDSCGNYWQTTSMYPGTGPCAAIYFETSEYLNRCYPVIPKEYYGLLLSSSAANASASAISSVRKG